MKHNLKDIYMLIAKMLNFNNPVKRKSLNHIVKKICFTKIIFRDESDKSSENYKFDKMTCK